MALWDSDSAKRQKKILNRFDPPPVDDDEDFWPRRPPKDPFRKDRYVAIALSATVVLIGLLAWCFGPSMRPKVAKTLPTSLGNLRLIGYALHLYHKENGQLPPPFLRDETGKPAHSWRVILLPYLARVDHEEETLLKAIYQDYSFSEPWDGPNNKKLIERMPTVYSLPHLDEIQTKTRFHAVIGDETAWPVSGVRTWDDFVDGIGETVLLIEDDEMPTTWTAPIDPTLQKWKFFTDPKPKRGDLKATRQYTVMFADRSIGGLSNLHETEYRRAFFTVAGREFIDIEFSKPGGTVKLPAEAMDDFVPSFDPPKAEASKPKAGEAAKQPAPEKGKESEKKTSPPPENKSPEKKESPPSPKQKSK